MAKLQGRRGQSYHSWRVVAAFVHGELTSGDPGNLDKPYKFHTVEGR